MAKKVKAKRINKGNYQSEDQNEAKRFIIILAIIIIVIVGVYFFTRIFVSKDLLNKETNTTTPGSINYNVTLIGAMLNKPEDDYFVMLYDSKKSDAVYYNGLVNNYVQDENALKIYIADIANELNKSYVGESENIKVTNIEDFKIANPALLKIKDSKIVNVYSTKDEMVEALKTK